MKIKEISDSEFHEFIHDENTYLTNGCFFNLENNNLVAFPVWRVGISCPVAFYEVLYV